MAKYQISDSQTGRTLTIEGDAPPTEQDATELFASLPKPDKNPVPAFEVFTPSRPKGIDFSGLLNKARQQPVVKAAEGVGGQFTQLAKAIPADIASVVGGAPKFGGNINAAAGGNGLPIDTAITQAAQEDKLRGQFPMASTVAQLSQDLAGTAPMIPLLGGMPAAAQKVALGLFTAKMIKDTPELASQLGEEFGKPPEQRDPVKIAKLVSSAIQTVGFTAAGGVGLKRTMTPETSLLRDLSTQPAPQPLTRPLATIEEQLAAKGIKIPSVEASSVPVQPSEAPKPVQTPRVVESSSKAPVGDALKQMGYDVKVWDMPGVGKQLQITSPEQGAAKGMTVYVPENATLEEVNQRLEQKRTEFETAEKPSLGARTTKSSSGEGESPASWVIRDKQTGAVVMETFNRSVADKVNTEKYEVVPIAQHLGELNKGVAQPSTAQPPSQSSETPAMVSSKAALPVKTEAVVQKATPKEPEMQVGKGPPKAKSVFFVRPRSDGIHDILDEIQHHGGIRSPDKTDVGGEYDGFNEVMNGTASLLRRRSGGLRPDVMVENVKQAFPRIKTTDDLWQAITDANTQRNSLKTKGGGAEAQTERFWNASKSPKRGLQKISVDDLYVGQKFRLKAEGISHEELTVASIDPDTNTVTVKDGPSFGIQDLPQGAEIYIAKGTLTEAPENSWALNEPETVEQQKAREATERANLEKKAQREELSRRAAKPLIGKRGDIGQADMLGGGDLLSQPTISRGPGAATAGEPGTYSPIQRMADELRTTAGEGKPIDEQLNALDKLRATGADAKDALTRAAVKTKAVADALWQKWKGLPEYGDEQRAVGKWFRALQQADHEARQFAKEVIREVPSKLRREAITNWIQADGDVSVLQDRASKSTGTIRQGYEIAAKLNPREVEIAQMLRNYYDQQLERGLGEGLIKEGLENYITQVWKKENPITKKLISELSGSKLQPNFKYARKRLFDSYFEGEQAGYIPNKDAGFLVANYDQTFNRSLAARAFIKDLHEGTASDGRPLVEISGEGKPIGNPGAQGVLVKPKSTALELEGYRTIDHPALRGWKWVSKAPDGTDIFIQGNMLVHPEAYRKLYNRLTTSRMRMNPVGRAYLGIQTTAKQTMLSLSGFHLVQEGLHALGHRFNPTDLPEIDFSEPTTRALAEHGLQLADYHALEAFSEGLAGGGLTEKIPILGPRLRAYNEWLFQDVIPRLKLKMATLTLERNRARYKGLSEDKLMELSASEANHAFGELPYRYMGRNPTLQDALRAFWLAPDFLESRARFVGRALMPHGREQLYALGVLAGTQYVIARIVNQLINKDPHWELKNAFRIIYKGHSFGLRTVPGDLLHLATDRRGFVFNRLSIGARIAFEAITGRDDRGLKRDVKEQVKDALSSVVPISIKPRVGQKWWETFLNSFGVQEQRWDAVQTIESKVAAFKKAHNIVSPVDIVYDREKDQYASLRTAIENGDEPTAKAEAAKLEKTIPKSKIIQHFRLSYTRPLTGSHKHEKAFVDELDAAGKEEYHEAMDLRKARLNMARSVLRE